MDNMDNTGRASYLVESGQTPLYFGELSRTAWSQINESIEEEFPTEWIHADVEVILENSDHGEKVVKVYGEETGSILPWKDSYTPEASYNPTVRDPESIL